MFVVGGELWERFTRMSVITTRMQQIQAGLSVCTALGTDLTKTMTVIQTIITGRFSFVEMGSAQISVSSYQLYNMTFEDVFRQLGIEPH